MNSFTNYEFMEIKHMTGLLELPVDFINVFSKKSYYKLLIETMVLEIGVVDSVEFIGEYNYNAMIYSEKCFKVGSFGDYDLVYIYKDQKFNLYLVSNVNLYSSFEMTLLDVSLQDIINSPKCLIQYIDFNKNGYFNDLDFTLISNFVNGAELPLEFYTMFGKNNNFAKTIYNTTFTLGAESVSELIQVQNNWNYVLPQPSLIIGEDDGEVNIMYLFEPNGKLLGLYAIHDDNLGDIDEAVYIAPSLSLFLKGYGYQEYEKV